MARPAIICDLDGCLALRGLRHPMDVETAGNDAICVPVASIVTLFRRNENPIIFITDRSERGREVTVRWLTEKVGFSPNTYELFMREDADTRPDHIVKRDLYERYVRGNYEVLFAVDNAERVVKMWKELGIFAVMV